MGVLKLQERIQEKSKVICSVLKYFDNKDLSSSQREELLAAGDHAFADEILYEEFENWIEEKDDDSFLYLINHFWETKDLPVLSKRKKDLTGNDAAIKDIEEQAKEEVAHKFAQLLDKLFSDRNITTYKEMGAFLGVSAQRASDLLKGKHKPNRTTIKSVSEKFNISSDRIWAEIF